GSSATGISEQIVAGMQREGVSREEARSRIWLVDSHGLVHDRREDLEPFKVTYAQPFQSLIGWSLVHTTRICFEEVIQNVHPTVLIGTSAQPGAFSEEIVREMAQYVERPIIFPLSNPTAKSEATPKCLLSWTNGRALIATGSPFNPVTINGRSVSIGQCNNAFIFPGIGLGVLASGAKPVSNEMFVAAAIALSELSPALAEVGQPLYPPLERVRDVSYRVALAVAREAQRSGLAEMTSEEELERRILGKIWTPHY
ncbi:MAG TPA: malic enzyme-like NAD(P)-binding protein, partial [Pyrinomonadaceae bacterium]|nr:malic enzyme-like NAD(P)-binding protein [Pyrinomonadaceae bacterium]